MLKAENRSDLFPVGRLDKDTTGLLIITNDGDLSHHLTSPRHHVAKTYLAGIEHSLKAEDIKALMKKPSNYTVYRERLINKHLVNTKERGFLQINLPLFDRFIEIWGN